MLFVEVAKSEFFAHFHDSHSHLMLSLKQKKISMNSTASLLA